MVWTPNAGTAFAIYLIYKRLNALIRKLRNIPQAKKLLYFKPRNLLKSWKHISCGGIVLIIQKDHPNTFVDIPSLSPKPETRTELSSRLGQGWGRGGVCGEDCTAFHLQVTHSNGIHSSPGVGYVTPSPELSLLSPLDTRWSLCETLWLIKKTCFWLLRKNKL